MKVLTVLMILIGALLVFAAIFMTSGAPQQGALAGLACFFAILARISQAEGNHSRILKAIEKMNTNGANHP